MHHIYHTEGIILDSKNFGETGKCFFIFTRDLGLVYATAQGVRKMSSKLRYVLSDYAYIKVDLVQGRDIWRVTSASKTNKLDNLQSKKENFKVLVNVARLLKRLLAGVEKNETLFRDLLDGLFVLEKAHGFDDLRNIEVVMVLRILSNLGYIGGGEQLDTLITSPFEKGLVFEVSKSRARVLNQINKALRESHL